MSLDNFNDLMSKVITIYIVFSIICEIVESKNFDWESRKIFFGLHSPAIVACFFESKWQEILRIFSQVKSHAFYDYL